MALLSRVRVALTGFPGGPGVMTFATTDVDTFIPVLKAWLIRVAVYMPADVSLHVESTGDTFESTTGLIQGTWARGVQPTYVGGSVGAYAAPVGVVVEWLTDIHLSGRRLRGRTFVVPCTTAAFSLDGSLDAAVQVEFQAASSAFAANSAGTFTIWQRPRLARPADGSRKAVLARGGGHGVVTSSRVPDKAAVLRSRRD